MGKGLVHIYCGDGKGKTTASLGLAVRAAGRGMKVLYVQFFKDGNSSEFKALEKVENITFQPPERKFGFFWTLTEAEKAAISGLEDLEWGEFNLEKLFGKSTRGRRLKSADRIPGDLPFVTAGEAEEGVSDFIGNRVKVFSENTTTIDMFGSAKYRNYKYGGDDHVAVVHTEKVPKNAAVFITSAIHKASHNGQFDYGKNFYAKDADELDISLPVREGKPDYDRMSLILSAVHKMVIRELVIYAIDGRLV